MAALFNQSLPMLVLMPRRRRSQHGPACSLRCARRGPARRLRRTWGPPRLRPLDLIRNRFMGEFRTASRRASFNPVERQTPWTLGRHISDAFAGSPPCSWSPSRCWRLATNSCAGPARLLVELRAEESIGPMLAVLRLSSQLQLAAVKRSALPEQPHRHGGAD
jgi:hypothetical protein